MTITDERPIEHDELMGVGVQAETCMHLTDRGKRVQVFSGLLELVEAAIKFEETWSACYHGCICPRCVLAAQTRRLARTLAL